MFSQFVEPLDCSCMYPLTTKQRARQYKLHKELKSQHKPIFTNECKYCGGESRRLDGASVEISKCERCKKNYGVIKNCSTCKSNGCSACGAKICPSCWKIIKHECTICRMLTMGGSNDIYRFCRDCCITCEGCLRAYCPNHDEKDFWSECKECGELLCPTKFEGKGYEIPTNEKKKSCFAGHSCRLTKRSEERRKHLRFISTHKTCAMCFSNDGNSAAGIGIVYTNLVIERGKSYSWGVRIDKIPEKVEAADHIVMQLFDKVHQKVHNRELLEFPQNSGKEFFSYLLYGKEFYLTPVYDLDRKAIDRITKNWPDLSMVLEEVQRGDIIKFKLNLVGNQNHYFQIKHREKVAKMEFPAKHSMKLGKKYHLNFDFSRCCTGITDKLTILNGKRERNRCMFCDQPRAKSKCSRCDVRYCSSECQKKDWKTHKFICISKKFHYL